MSTTIEREPLPLPGTALCGVSACASIWSKYGVSIGKLFGQRMTLLVGQRAQS